MIYELFNTTITITPASYSHSNRSAVYKQEPDSKKTDVPALITMDDKGYVVMDEDLQIKKGDVITDETTENKYTVSNVFPMGDLYKLELTDKNV